MSRGTWQGSGTWQTTGGGGGGLVLAVIAAAILVGSGAASAIASALVTVVVIVAVILVLAVVGVVALLVYRARQNGPGRPTTARPIAQLPPKCGPDCRPGPSSSSRGGRQPSRPAARRRPQSSPPK